MSRQPESHSLRSLLIPEGFALTGTLLAFSPIPAAMAADSPPKKTTGEPDALADIVVTESGEKKLYKPEKLASPKYVKPLVDVAQTVTVVPKEVIQEQGATTLSEVLRNVPGITMQAGENGGAHSTAGDMFTLRGFDAANSIFTDGVRDDGLISRDTFNVESVEAFLGPAGSDVGRGTAAGYVNMQTKVPQMESFYNGSTAFSSGNRMRNTIDVNQNLCLGNDGDWIHGSAIRLNGLYQFGGVAGRDEVERNTWAIAPSLAFGLGTDTRVYLQYQHVQQDNIPDYGLPAFHGRPLPGIHTEWFYGYPYADHEDTEQDSFTLRLEHDFSDTLKLRNQTRYNQTSRDDINSGIQYFGPGFVHTTPASGFPNTVRIIRQSDIRENEIFSNMTTLNAAFDTGPLKHALVGGLEYTWEKQDGYQYFPSSIGGQVDLPAPWVPNPYGGLTGFNPRIDPSFHNRGEVENLGVYVFDAIDIGKHWMVSGGLRMDSYDTTYASRATVTAGGNPGALTGPFDASDEIFSGKAAVSYKPDENSSIYLAYGHTVTPPGTANFSLNTTTNPTSGAITSNANINSDPQESTNIELGGKWDVLDAKLSLTSALFYTRNENTIYQNDPTDLTSYSQDGAQDVYGATVGAFGSVTENWNVFANVTYLDATLDQPGATAGIPPHSIDGNRLTRTPKFSGSFWTTYHLPKGFTVGGGLRYQGRTYTSTSNFVDTPAYAVLDGMIQYDINEQVNVRLNVYNLLDREYVASAGGGGGQGGGTINNAATATGGRVNMGQPLSFMLSTNFTF